jgi:hypothetical protein
LRGDLIVIAAESGHAHHGIEARDRLVGRQQRSAARSAASAPPAAADAWPRPRRCWPIRYCPSGRCDNWVLSLPYALRFLLATNSEDPCHRPFFGHAALSLSAARRWRWVLNFDRSRRRKE